MGFSGKSTGVGGHFLLQGIFPTQGLNLGLPHYRQVFYRLSYHRVINKDEVKYTLNVFSFLCATEYLQQLKQEQGRWMGSDIKGYQVI